MVQSAHFIVAFCIPHTSYFILHIGNIIACLACKHHQPQELRADHVTPQKEKHLAATNQFFIARNCAKKSILTRTKISYKKRWPDPPPPRSRTERGLSKAEAFEVRLGTLQLGAPGQRHQQTARHGRHWQNARHQLVGL